MLAFLQKSSAAILAVYQQPVKRAGWLYNFGNVFLLARSFWQGDAGAFDPLPLLASFIFFVGNYYFSAGRFRFGCALSAAAGLVLAGVMYAAGAMIAALFILVFLCGGMVAGAAFVHPLAQRLPGLGGLISRLPAAGDVLWRGDWLSMMLFLIWFAADISLMQKAKSAA